MNKYKELKIASAVLEKSIKDFADEAGVSEVALRGVAQGTITSAKLSQFIDQKVSESEAKFQASRSASA